MPCITYQHIADNAMHNLSSDRRQCLGADLDRVDRVPEPCQRFQTIKLKD